MRQAGIIGSGNIGSAVTQRLVANGWEVLLANKRGPTSLTDPAAALGAKPATLEQAARALDLVLLAIPQYAIADLPADLFAEMAADTLVLDAGNYYPGVRDGQIAAIDEGMTDSEWVARTIGRPVVKMFNTIHAARIATSHRPAGAPDRICLPVAADDAAARTRAIQLADALGFDAIDAGTLAESWAQQPGTPVYCKHLPIEPTREALAEARRMKGAAHREEAIARARNWQREGSDVGQWQPDPS